MTRLDDTAVDSYPGRLKHVFIRACVLSVFMCLVFYACALADMNAVIFTTDAPPPESWNASTLLEKAVHKLQTVLMFPRKRKLILLWTSYFGAQGDWLPSTQDLQCPVSDCDVTSNRSLLTQSSAVVLHWRNVDVSDLPECTESSLCPLWVLFNMEAPPHTPKDILAKIQDRVHWTATYRRDSDVYAPYGKVVRQKNPEVSENVTDRRSVCWLVSNCDTPSKRELFVRDLQKYIEVDIYGKCGTQKCPHELTKDCYQWLSKRCKFYLSLENSNCRDYFTEKLYHAMAFGMVPIVMGNSSNYADLLPPRSYISTKDFSSSKELAEYLVIVGEDQKMYQSYNWWRTRYEVKDFSYKWLCELCQKLHGITHVSSTVAPRRNLVSWWFDQSGCIS